MALLEAEKLPASDLTETHLEHFFFTGADGAPSALVGLEIYGEAALLRSLVVSARMVEVNEQPCCYAKSGKYWVTDPTGIAWETFHTLGRIPVYGEDTAVFNHGECEGSDAAKAFAFRQALKELETRIKLFLQLPIGSLDQMTLREKLRRIGRPPTKTEA